MSLRAPPRDDRPKHLHNPRRVQRDMTAHLLRCKGARPRCFAKKCFCVFARAAWLTRTLPPETPVNCNLTAGVSGSGSCQPETAQVAFDKKLCCVLFEVKAAGMVEWICCKGWPVTLMVLACRPSPIWTSSGTANHITNKLLFYSRPGAWTLCVQEPLGCVSRRNLMQFGAEQALVVHVQRERETRRVTQARWAKATASPWSRAHAPSWSLPRPCAGFPPSHQTVFASSPSPPATSPSHARSNTYTTCMPSSCGLHAVPPRGGASS